MKNAPTKIFHLRSREKKEKFMNRRKKEYLKPTRKIDKLVSCQFVSGTEIYTSQRRIFLFSFTNVFE